jgi:hypothetical protein
MKVSTDCRLVPVIIDGQGLTDYGDEPFQMLFGALAFDHSVIFLIISAYKAARDLVRVQHCR